MNPGVTEGAKRTCTAGVGVRSESASSAKHASRAGILVLVLAKPAEPST